MIQPVKISNLPAGQNCGPEYATVNAWSKDNKHLLLTQSGGWFRLHTGEGEYVRTLPSAIHTSSRPRWSRTDPDHLTYLEGKSLRRYNAKTNNAGTINVFDEYASIQDSGEADLSQDGNHRVLAGTKADGSNEIFVFDLVSRTKGKIWRSTAWDGLKIATDNRILVSRPDGIFLGFDTEWQQIAPRNAHACPCVYKGRPSLAWFNGAQHMVLIDIDTRVQTVVPFVIDYKYTAHVSACDKQILAISLSTDDNGLPGQIVKISLEDLSAEVICEFATVHRDNDSQPNASLSRDGSRIVFRVDDGQQRSAWMLKLEPESIPVPVPVPLSFDLRKGKWQIEGGILTQVKAA